MTAIKFCGLTRMCDIEAANALKPEFIGFVFAEKSRRFVTKEQAALLKEHLDPAVKSVGVFVNADISFILDLAERNIIDLIQLHGNEDESYISSLRRLTDKKIIKAFIVRSAEDVQKAAESSADFVLLDSGAGSGKTFDFNLIQDIKRPYFLAGGLNTDNAASVLKTLHPFALDVSSGIETEGLKDKNKMAIFAAIVRKENDL